MIKRRDDLELTLMEGLVKGRVCPNPHFYGPGVTFTSIFSLVIIYNVVPNTLLQTLCFSHKLQASVVYMLHKPLLLVCPMLIG